MDHLVVFSRHQHAYRATPGNLVARYGGSKDGDNVVFRNITTHEITLELTGPSAPQHVPLSWPRRSGPSLTVAPGTDEAVPLSGLPDGQYLYVGRVAGTGLEVQGGSGPGIIITP